MRVLLRVSIGRQAKCSQLKLEENASNTSRTEELEKEVKEKTILINKLRHEGLSSPDQIRQALTAIF